MYMLKCVRESLRVSWCNGNFKSEFPSVQKLIDYLWLRKTGSTQSLGTYLFTVHSFTKWVNSSDWTKDQFNLKACSSPDDFLSISRDALGILVQRFLDEMRGRSRERGCSARYVNVSLACLKRFFQVNGFCRENNNELRLQGYHQPARTRNIIQYVPSLSEACQMAERGRILRNRAIILTLFSSGLRNTALRAVRVGDVLKEIEVGQDNLIIKVEPEWNKRIPGACKGSIPYYTFTSESATQSIKEMLKRRREVSNSISEDEPLFTSGGTQKRKRKALCQRELQYILKTAAREAEIKEWRNVSAHSLRKVFESILRSQTNDGGRMDAKDQEFLMGHILPGVQDAYYDWSKINTLRTQFAKLVFEDVITPEQETLNTHQKLALLLDIDIDKIKAEKEMALGRTLLKREELEMLKRAIKTRTSPQRERKEQKIVPKNELKADLSNGWKFVASIDEESAVIERFISNSETEEDLANTFT